MDNKIIDTGLMFNGHPILFGPRKIDGRVADKYTLVRLDGFLKKHLPNWYEITRKPYGQGK